MTRHTFVLTVTVDVDDVPALADVDVLGVPTADEAISALLFDAIREHAAPALEQHGVHVVGLGAAADDASTTGDNPVQRSFDRLAIPRRC